MYCANCSKHLAMCDCADIDERLAGLAAHPSTALLAHQAKAQRQAAAPEREKAKLTATLAKQKEGRN